MDITATSPFSQSSTSVTCQFLNDELSYALPVESKFKIYISALTQLNVDEHNRVSTTDGRLIRRMVRDHRTRGASAKRTLEMWDSVRRGEEKNIFPFQEQADIMFNSSLAYEISVLKPYVEPLLFSIKEEDLTKFQQEGKRYGILYCPIVNKLECTGTIEIMARARDARQINHVLERMGYPVPREWEVDEKKQKLPVLSGNNLSGHENGVKVTEMETAIEERERQSVKEKLETLKAASKLTEKVKELLSDTQLEESRIATEVILYADKICTEEETFRLHSHIESMKQTLQTGGSIGRKLDFIAQEMNREANTILSKANDLETSNLAINLKTEIEKVREQIQNIE